MLVACWRRPLLFCSFGYVFLIVFAIVGIAHLLGDLLDLDRARSSRCSISLARFFARHRAGAGQASDVSRYRDCFKRGY